jgi:tRNA(Ile)-lysidine synthase
MPGSGDLFLEQLYLTLHGLIMDQRSVILAVSGGCDSVALMVGATRLSDRLKARFEVVTVDHGLRSSSAHDAHAVVRQARALGLPAHVRKLRMKKGAGIEERARIARYETLDSARKARRFAWVATAHTANDQAETLLQRLARGSALTGAGSILEKRDRIIRPMLFATRTQVRKWLRAQRVPWLEDPMNEDTSLLRVRLRKRVVPALERATDAKVTLRLSRFARFAAEDDAHLQAEADLAFEAARISPRVFDRAALLQLPAPIARRVMARWLRGLRQSVDGELIERMRTAVAKGGVATLPGDLLLKCRRGNVVIESH